MKKIALTISLLLNSAFLFAQSNPEMPLYPNGIENNPITHPNQETVADSIINLIQRKMPDHCFSQKMLAQQLLKLRLMDYKRQKLKSGPW